MSVDDDVTAWIDDLHQGDPDAARRLWGQYYQQLVGLASRRLPKNIRREFDEEDVALSAFHSLCRGVSEGRLPDIADRDSLWALLIVITSRKCNYMLRRQTTKKRGGGEVRGESAFEGLGIASGPDSEPTPDFANQISEEISRLLNMLSDDVTKQLAILKMEGFTNNEAAQRLDCSVTTVERRLRLIRTTWSEQFA